MLIAVVPRVQTVAIAAIDHRFHVDVFEAGAKEFSDGSFMVQ